jgi:quinol monooxygenase YgiN
MRMVPAYSRQKENSVSGPLISVTTAKIKDGKLEDFKRFTAQFLENVQAREQRLIAFNVFLNEDGTEMTSIQVHPDADSMDSHMQLLPQLLGEEMNEWVDRADFLDVKHIEIYGTPSAALLEADQQWVDSGVFSRTVKPVHVAGFTRGSVGAT